MNNLGFQTDFFFLEEGREIIEKDDFTIVRSPNQPNFYYGNYLLLKKSPKNTDKEILERIFKENFINKMVKHFTFCWSGNKTENLFSFLNSGYELEEMFVLTAKEEDFINFENGNQEVSIRSFQTKEDWQKMVELECSERPSAFEEKNYRLFLEGRSDVYQKLFQKNQGNFYGAFIGNELVASAGLFYQNGIGRFQSVRTKEAFRRRKICQSLMSFICKEGFHNLETLVIAAEKDYHALNLYKNLGFKETDSQTSVYWKKE